MKNKYFLLRLLVFAALMLLILRPVRKVYRTGVPPSVAVLLDDSESMGRVVTPRAYESAKGKIVSQIAGNKYRLSYFTFSGDFRRVFPEDIGRVKPAGRRTDIAGALDKLRNEFLGRELDAVVLFTDGNHNTGGDVAEAVEEYRGLGIPVIAVAPKKEEESRNVAVTDVNFPDIVFRNTVSTVTVRLSVSGFAGKKISVYLKSGGKIAAARTVDVAEDGTLDVPFEIKPEHAGINGYSAEIPTYKGERAFSDNVKNFSLNVEPEKIRILYLCGQPSFNYSFLRAALKSDPGTELVTFVILRNPENIVAVADNELSLIPFPVDELFSKEIFNFDVVILENFNYSRFAITQQHLANIRNIVAANGKSLLVISGEVPLSVYRNTPIDELLPVEPGSDIVSGRFKLDVLLPDHGVMKLSDDPGQSGRAWAGMPELDGFNVTAARNKTVVLASAAKYGAPVIAVAEKGKGRVMCVTTSSLWRLALGGENPYNYTRFWGQAVKWLLNAPSMRQVAMFYKTGYAVNDTADMKIKVKDEYSRPVNNAAVTLAVTYPGGRKDILPVPPSANDGEYEIGIDLQSAGDYRLEAAASSGRRQLGSDRGYFTVNDVSLEAGDVTVNEPLLKEIAAGTGGEYFTADDFSAGALKIARRKDGQDVLYEINLWNKPAFYVLILVMLFVEWYLRRRSGLL